ncbi:Tn7-like transposition protein A [Calothrix sp. NIES-2100]|uniref:TnsA endonuclease N-terminal domain-containing protein n=1 Tax=Calothrix sp. NIES-2100 TaxID=1954172 RepID=UPI000B6024DC|nr:Tn7-like transposition protein A [Calothrix sp. NIES-2100]
MAKRRRATNQAVIDKRISQGRGEGRGHDYTPWLLIQDVASQGLATRTKGWKTKRVHHLLSKMELNYFYALEWSPIVYDIREQYPLLPLEETVAIAEQCGIPHPKDPKTQEFIVMTTDFVITIPQNIGICEQARTVKPAKELDNKRTIEKFEIERRYWESRNTSWGIVTEHEIPSVLTNNIAHLHNRFYADDLSLSEREIAQVKKLLTQWVMQRDERLTELTAECDDRLGLEAGDSLSVAWHLLATRQWLVDMNQPINPRQKLLLLNVQSVDIDQPIREIG